MKSNMNDRVPVKGTVSRATSEAMRRGEIESNNGLRKSSGRRSWNPEQPEFELDYGPTFGQMVAQAFRQVNLTVLDISSCPKLVSLVENNSPSSEGGVTHYSIGYSTRTYDSSVSIRKSIT